MSLKSDLYSLIPGVSILMMHHMCERPDELSDCVISRENFLKVLAGKRFISWDKAVEHPSQNNGAYSLTIDDGLADLYEIYLICRERGIPITAFISTGFIGQDGYISKDRLLEMANDPLVTIGSHGQTHTRLTDCDGDRAKTEIFFSKKALEDLLEKEIKLYAYPNGAFTDRDLSFVKSAGYRWAFSVVPRKNTFLTKRFSRLAIPRFNLTNDTFSDWL